MVMTKKNKIFLAALAFMIFVLPFIIFAQDVSIENPVTVSTVEDFLRGVSWFLWALVVAIVPIMMIWAGILFVTSEGNPERVKKAKNLVTYIIVGIVVALVASGITTLLANILSE
jgi:hypothetical protein